MQSLVGASGFRSASNTVSRLYKWYWGGKTKLQLLADYAIENNININNASITETTVTCQVGSMSQRMAIIH